MPVNAATLSTPQLPSAAGNRRVATRLVGAVMAAVLVAAGVEAAAIAISGAHAWWPGWSAALMVTIVATAFSLVPLVLGVRAGAEFAAYGFLGGTVARMLCTVVGLITALFVFRAPPFATLMLIVPLYLAALVAECAALWRLRAAGK